MATKVRIDLKLLGDHKERQTSTQNLPFPSTESSEDRVQAVNGIGPDWSPAEERALVRKLDIRILIPCFVIYVLAYLDRGNIGSVKVLQIGKPDSIERSLHMKGTEFNWAVSGTYFLMTVFLLPSILLLKRTSAKFYFPVVMIGFGGIVMCTAAVKSGPGLILARIFLGVPESGVAPAIAFYFSFWYLPKERAFRIGVLFSANATAVGLSGLLADAIDNLNGRNGLKSWQWVFLIEGAICVGLAFPFHFILLSFPENTTALSERGQFDSARQILLPGFSDTIPERYIAINRFGRGSTRKTDVSWSWPAFFSVMRRPSTYVFFVSYMALLMLVSAQANFLPSILLAFLHYSPSKANLYAAATAFATLPFYWAWPFHSDWTRERLWHYIIPLLGCIPAYSIWTWSSGHPHQHSVKPIALYGVAFLAQMPTFAQPSLIAYRTSTLYGASEQAIGTAATFAALSIGSIIAPQMFPNADAPLYHEAFVGTCAIVAVAIVSALTIPYWLSLEARTRKRKYGHAMPLRAIDDAGLSQTTDAAHRHNYELTNRLQRAALAAKNIEIEQVQQIEDQP
ncbi:uncharacterized protein PV07_09681 [Cladophialophora immunda]|uniref:Major facilitator superfamily (MFS) profile domain-containing protein n=1 Tax=Cladophialophora immunda TaxID=569365 RepID=A0A0D2CK60_9EURO|nr:uncharacterized protein PV07_09681 [Cladophialophora immunda]KIW23934.1 hypothetical protein PV07_09681 [Cladophialophora immunda]